MKSDLVKIPVSRLLAQKPFARELFLWMPRNEKLLRLARKDGELSPTTLQRISRDPHVEVYALPVQGDDKNPDRFPLFASSAIMVADEEPESRFSAEADSEHAAKVSSEEAEEQSQQRVVGKSEDEQTTALQNSEEPGQPENAFSSALEEEGEQGFSATETSASAQKVAAASEPDSERGISETQDAEAVQKISGQAADAAALAAFQSEEQDELELAALSDPAEELAEPRAIEVDLLGAVEKFRAKAAEGGNEELEVLGNDFEGAARAFSQFAAGQTKDPAALSMLKETLEVAVETISGLPAEAGQAILQGAQTLGATMEQAVASVEEALTQSAILLAKQKESGQPGKTAKHAEAAFDEAAARNAAAYKETPQIAGRMAAELAFSLGYGNLDFLSDLALSAVILFSVNAGAKVAGDSLSSLNRAILSKESRFAESAFEDSSWIIGFLEKYFHHPDCDRTQKEFSKRVFESALAEYVSESAVDPLVAARWKRMVERGTTMSAASLSGKAISRAYKTSKSFLTLPATAQA